MKQQQAASTAIFDNKERCIGNPLLVDINYAILIVLIFQNFATFAGKILTNAKIPYQNQTYADCSHNRYNGTSLGQA
jgi:hypothetical protein